MPKPEWTNLEMNENVRAVFYEIANRASNMMDDDAADWLPSIYRLACDATGEDPWPTLEAAGFKRDGSRPTDAGSVT